MALVDDVQLLKSPPPGTSEAETLAAALRLMDYLDRALWKSRVWRFPRGYYYDVAGSGSDQLCMPTWVDSEEEAARIFAQDVATGWLEELCGVLDARHAAPIRAELGLGQGESR
jgi:hypothetical protein